MHQSYALTATFILLFAGQIVTIYGENTLVVDPLELSVVRGGKTTIQFKYSGEPLDNELYIELETTAANIRLNPSTLVLGPNTTIANVEVNGLDVTSLTFIDVKSCTWGSGNHTGDECPFNKTSVFVRVKVVHSHAISVLVIVTGWIYFFAWSISFYPQIILNYKRKSVVGLNFDFLVLNVIGFFCYTIYNVMLYFDMEVQNIYIETHARSLIPVLLNDVVFASHALLACIITVFQCFIYERAAQRVSYICCGWSSLLIAFSGISLLMTLVNVLNWLQFINYLAYVKMAVTLSKYFPQAILNFRRKSTVGWSIGNVLLDFSGGFMDICQMVLQGSNTEDWSAFYGNPVKFGLGMISMVFDVVFIIQHYGLYRDADPEADYNQVDTNDVASITSENRERAPIVNSIPGIRT
ncbi:PQ loop repeat domain-containing protein [Ditylenchus destructor]|nr:PQ loop repeat domain-containing protein [Ditylenchus destructor]